MKNNKLEWETATSRTGPADRSVHGSLISWSIIFQKLMN